MEQATTVVDVTYLCNATCKYCQWGNNKNPNRKHFALDGILIYAETIKALGTERIVLSGGEPRLHPLLPKVLSYYRKLVDSVIVMSNGYGLTRREVLKLIKNGATGVTISLDSTLPGDSLLTKETSSYTHAQILSNLSDICRQPRKFEVGLNSVVSHVTANWRTVSGVLEFGNRLGADFAKFQPVFNDGYVGLKAPQLMLSSVDSPQLLDICRLLETIDHPPTNPSGFWKNVSDLVEGKELSSRSCGLGSRHSMVIGNRLNICYWLNAVSFGTARARLQIEDALIVRRNFEKAKLGCKVGFHCFCNQDLYHTWANRRGEEEKLA